MASSSFSDTDGAITFSLYHGTSTFFLPLIMERGLGGRNIIKEWRVLDFFRGVIQACNKVEDAEFQRVIKSREWTINRILEVEPHNPAGSNWRYGAVYLSADRKKAASYAVRGHGSELLRLSCGWHCDLARHKPDVAAELFSQYPEIATAAKATHLPVVIELPRLHITELATETGLTGKPLEDKLTQWLEIRSLFETSDNSTANCSFEYIGPPMPAHRFRVFDVSAELKGYYVDNIVFKTREAG